ncbi:uncharacterized protein LOC131687153 [Topomyia yanbarensis]|uniref:uncharacterized protein LOC131687153 n=1 Tax=Topomyia yanbarensis TaxID=2498891 RepID=UPI00273B112C|nr:uncharacterized protein LOC131687153 [Topomyia yanbarensis]
MTDGGITQGTDVFKALALGAKMVFVGRAAIWGLAVNGQNGVENVLELLKLELDSVMAMAGCKTIKQISENHVRFEWEYLSPRSRLAGRININQKGFNNPVDDDGDDDEAGLAVETVKVVPPVPEKIVLIPTGEDGLSKDPRGEDGVDECGKDSNKCKTVKSEIEIVRAPQRITREVRVVPELAKVFQRNANIGSNSRQFKVRHSRHRAASMHNLVSINKPVENCRCIL